MPTPILRGGWWAQLAELLFMVRHSKSYDWKWVWKAVFFVPNVGSRLQVGRSTIEAALARLKKLVMSRIYFWPEWSIPNTFLQSELGNIKNRSKFLWLVSLTKPGSYKWLPYLPLFFNGPCMLRRTKWKWSFRNIQVYRELRLISNGRLFMQFPLERRPIIEYHTYRTMMWSLQRFRQVEIIGPVRREGLFEVKQGRNIFWWPFSSIQARIHQSGIQRYRVNRFGE